MTTPSYELLETSGVPIKAWTRGVPVEDAAIAQLSNIARLPFVHRHVAVMPDVHVGIGATVGSVIPTRGAIIPAAVGVDIGCGMMAVRTIAARVGPARQSRAACVRRSSAPCRTAAPSHGGRGDRGAWGDAPGPRVDRRGRALEPGYRAHRGEASEGRRGARPPSTSARSAPATTSSRSASTRRTASG